MTAKHTVTIHVRQEKPGKLSYAIAAADGSPIAKSTDYATICKLEAGLVELRSAVRAGGASPLEIHDGLAEIPLPGRRKTVQLKSRVDAQALQAALNALPDAMIVDERPVGRRRTDLSGALCELNP